MPTRAGLEDGFFLALAIILFLQVIVVTSSALSTRFRRRHTNVRLGRMQLDSIRIGANDVHVFTYGKDLYGHMLDDIQHAKHMICIESFIWKGDLIGEEFKRAVIEKADEGIAVYIIFDAFANLVVKRAFKKFPANVSVCRYKAWRRLLDVFDIRRWARDHRKLLVIDKEIAYVGGYNIGDLYGEKWRDTHVRVAGDAALNLHQSFSSIWNENAVGLEPLAPVPTSLQPYIRLYSNNPTWLIFPIRSMYIDAIDLAKERIMLTTPYFIPDRYVLSSLMKAAKRGVDVQLMVPEQSNHLLADWLARTYFTDCLRQGIHVYLYRDAMIHAKTATIDGMWTTIGTANLDRLSLVGNHELNLEFFDANLASQMEKIFLEDRESCRELQLYEWIRRPLAQKLGELVLSPFWPFL